MSALLELAEMETPDEEMIPEMLPVDARLSVKGPVTALQKLFERAASVAPVKEIILGTSYSLLESFEATSDSVSYVRITATDGEQTISVMSDDLDVAMAGKVLLPAKRISAILKLAPTETVKLEVLGSAATVRAGRAQWTVQTPAGDSLPPLANVDQVKFHDMIVDEFLHALVTARKAVGQVFRNALMQLEVSSSAITGSDGMRLHRQKMNGFPENLSLTIPLAVADELIKTMRSTGEGVIQIGASESHLAFRIGADSIIANRLMLPYPNVENLVLEPAFSNNHSLVVDATELKAVIQRVRVNADQEYASIFLAILPGKKDSEGNTSFTLAVRVRDASQNTAQEVMECQFKGPAKTRELCLNHKSLTDLLDAYGSGEAIFRLGDDTKTVRTPLFLEDTSTGFTGVVQQMNSEWLK